MTQIVLQHAGHERLSRAARLPRSRRATSTSAAPRTGTGPKTRSKTSAASLGHADCTIEPGEAAFYGPKIDFVVTDCIGREWQLGTVQLDYNLPTERFDLEYIGADNQPHRPVMIHRAPFGSHGAVHRRADRAFRRRVPAVARARAGARADRQRKVRGLRPRSRAESCGAAGLRVTGDYRAEKLGAKIRDAQLELIPYMFVVGPRDAEAGTVTVRDRIEGDLGAMPLDAAIDKVQSRSRGPSKFARSRKRKPTGLGERGGAHEY